MNAHRLAVESSRFLAARVIGLGTYHGLRRKHVDTYLDEFVFRYNRRFFRHVSFETMLGLVAGHQRASYWDIIERDNARQGRPTLEPTQPPNQCHAANPAQTRHIDKPE